MRVSRENEVEGLDASELESDSAYANHNDVKGVPISNDDPEENQV